MSRPQDDDLPALRADLAARPAEVILEYLQDVDRLRALLGRNSSVAETEVRDVMQGRDLRIRIEVPGRSQPLGVTITAQGAVEVEVVQKDFDPDLSIEGEPEDIAELILGDLHPLMAFYRGVLKFNRDVEELVHYGRLYDVFQSLVPR